MVRSQGAGLSWFKPRRGKPPRCASCVWDGTPEHSHFDGFMHRSPPHTYVARPNHGTWTIELWSLEHRNSVRPLLSLLPVTSAAAWFRSKKKCLGSWVCLRSLGSWAGLPFVATTTNDNNNNNNRQQQQLKTTTTDSNNNTNRRQRQLTSPAATHNNRHPTLPSRTLVR